MQNNWDKKEKEMSQSMAPIAQVIRKITLSSLQKKHDTHHAMTGDRYRGIIDPQREAPPHTSMDTPPYVSLPPASFSQTVQRVQAPLSSAASCILLIEDSATLRQIVTTSLTQAGYDTRAFADGIEALRWLAEPGSRVPNLMLVDLGLPKMDGYEVIKRIKTKPQYAHTACIILSRRDGKVDKLKGKLAGATMYLSKPFTIQDLLTAVHASITEDSSH
jgi:twitching motility two-component system response regulator PilG